jgi:predicted hotdog family 3-hydroxylacyl-ACP dehydratase
MLMLDGCEPSGPESFRAWLTLRWDNPFVDDDGTLERAAYPELIAQCFAAGAGSRRKGDAGQPLGFLAGFRDMVIHGDARVGDVLTAEATIAASLGKVSVVDGTVSGPGGTLATGQIKVFLEDAAASPA